eukprot:21389-Heterococcus_DN1.PRE.3
MLWLIAAAAPCAEAARVFLYFLLGCDMTQYCSFTEIFLLSRAAMSAHHTNRMLYMYRRSLEQRKHEASEL